MEKKTPTLQDQFLLFSRKKPEMDGRSFTKAMKDSKLMGGCFSIDMGEREIGDVGDWVQVM